MQIILKSLQKRVILKSQNGIGIFELLSEVLNSNLEGLTDMAKKDIYDWPEGEDDNIDFDAIHEQNKNKTVEDLDRE